MCAFFRDYGKLQYLFCGSSAQHLLDLEDRILGKEQRVRCSPHHRYSLRFREPASRSEDCAEESTRLLFRLESTISTFPYIPEPRDLLKILGLAGFRAPKSSIDGHASFRRAWQKAPNAARRAASCAGKHSHSLCGCGPWTVPPCRQSGLRMLPIRARPGPLLPPQLLAAAADFAAGFGRGRSGPKGVTVMFYSFPDQGLVELRLEHRIRKLQLSNYLVGEVS